MPNIGAGTHYLRQTNVKVATFEAFSSRRSLPPFMIRNPLNCSCIIDDLQTKYIFLYFLIFIFTSAVKC